MKSFGKRNVRLAVAILLVVAVALSLWLGLRAGREDGSEGKEALRRASARRPGETAGPAGASRRGTEPGTLEAQRREALDLVERMRGPALEYPVTRMARVGEEFPQDLLDELAAMNAEQFQTVVLAIGKDRTINHATRTTVVISMASAWMKRQKGAGRRELEMVLGVIEELLPEFPTGYDFLPVNCVINPGAGWDAETMAAFIVKHWDRWGGADSASAETLRQSMLRHAGDPEVALEQMKVMGAPQDLHAGGQEMARGASEVAKGPQAITATFRRIEEEFEGPQAAELRAGMVSGLGERLTVWSPAEVDAWLPDSGLRPEEREILLEKLSLPRNAETALDWIRWMEPRMPRAKVEQQIAALGNQWAFEDAAAAERWIAALPEGPMRAIAVRGFLEVAKDPGARERVGTLVR